MAYFQVADPARAHYLQGFKAANAGEIQTGVLVLADADAKLTLAGTADKPFGFALGLRSLVYAPTVKTLDADEAATVINGRVTVWADSSYFYGGLPSVGDTIYTYTGGLMRAGTGTVTLGKCIKTNTYRTQPNTTSNIVLLDLELGGPNQV